MYMFTHLQTGLEDKQREQQGTVEVLKREIMRLEMEREAEHSKLKDLKGEPQDISPSVTSQPLPNKGKAHSKIVLVCPENITSNL